MVCSCDLPARALVTNMLQFNVNCVVKYVSKKCCDAVQQHNKFMLELKFAIFVLVHIYCTLGSVIVLGIARVCRYFPCDTFVILELKFTIFVLVIPGAH